MAAKATYEPETLADLQSPFQPSAVPVGEGDTDSGALQLNERPPFDMGWAAGFFDGEGCITIARQQITGRPLPSFHLRASIWQNDRQVLEHFRDGIGAGGTIYLTKSRAYLLEAGLLAELLDLGSDAAAQAPRAVPRAQAR